MRHLIVLRKDGRGAEVRVPTEARFLSSLPCSGHFWGPTNVPSSGYRGVLQVEQYSAAGFKIQDIGGFFLGDNKAEATSWQHISN
jgi:hypothetical protein